MKDTPVDRLGPRERLLESLDAVFAEPIDPAFNLDAVEGKLFGIGVESYTVGSHEFYFGYAQSRRLLLTLDTGHYHPTETIADKISAVLAFVPGVLLHLSRGVRWDSDHVVLLTDDVEAIGQELVRGNYLSRVHIGLDFFDASINRVAAWVIGARNVMKALLKALLEPTARLEAAEAAGDYTTRLALLEEYRTLPFGPVWDAFCERSGVPVAEAWIADVKRYEADVLSSRSSTSLDDALRRRVPTMSHVLRRVTFAILVVFAVAPGRASRPSAQPPALDRSRAGVRDATRRREATRLVALDERQHHQGGDQARSRVDAPHRHRRLPELRCLAVRRQGGGEAAGLHDAGVEGRLPYATTLADQLGLEEAIAGSPGWSESADRG